MTRSQPFMRSTLESAISFTFASLMFMLALAYSVDTIMKNSQYFTNAPGTEGTVYIQETTIPKEVLFTGAELIGSLYKLNFDEQQVVVSNIAINTNRDFEAKQQFILRTANYKQSIEYDGQGVPKKLIYTIK